MTKIKLSQSVGEIVTWFPKTSEVFKKHHIDFCCGGNTLLELAIKESGVQEAPILAELEEAVANSSHKDTEINFTELSRTALIDYVVEVHHAYLRRELPEISAYVTKILNVHGAHHPELFKVHKLFHQIKQELEVHIVKEEISLFPLIKQYDETVDADLAQRIKQELSETESEHDAAGDIVKELQKITNDYTMPKGGCRTFFITYEKLKELEADLFQHIHLENNILFREFDLL